MPMDGFTKSVIAQREARANARTSDLGLSIRRDYLERDLRRAYENSSCLRTIIHTTNTDTKCSSDNSQKLLPR